MNKLLTGILAASLALGTPVLAQDDTEYDYDPETVKWEVKLLDADGEEVFRRARATDAVATVLGPRKYQLSIGCSRGDRTRFIRIQRLVDNEDKAEFSGRVFDPVVEVRYRGEAIFTTERGTLRWQDEGYYEPRRGPRHRRADAGRPRYFLPLGFRRADRLKTRRILQRNRPGALQIAPNSA